MTHTNDLIARWRRRARDLRGMTSEMAIGPERLRVLERAELYDNCADEVESATAQDLLEAHNESL